jgi:hypothetical protein
VRLPEYETVLDGDGESVSVYEKERLPDQLLVLVTDPVRESEKVLEKEREPETLSDCEKDLENESEDDTL